MVSVITAIVQCESAAKDLIQEVFLRVWLNRDQLPDIELPRAWIFRIAYFQSYSWLRHKKVRDRAAAWLRDGQSPVEINQTADVLLSMHETGKLILEAIDQLTPQAQKIYRLSREQNLKPAEIAAQQGLSVQTVKNTLSRALKSIREYLGLRGVFIPIFLIWCWLF